MVAFMKRLIAALAAGYILMYFSELMFWASYDPDGMALSQLLITYIAYSVLALVFLSVVNYFKVHTVWSLFLAGALYGFLGEGLLVQTLYGTPDIAFPLTISWTSLAWHSLITILIGWFVVRKNLVSGSIMRMGVVSTLIGIGYGFWAVMWLYEPGHRMNVLLLSGDVNGAIVKFFIFALLSTLPLIPAYWIATHPSFSVSRPSRTEVFILSAIFILYFILVTLKVNQTALFILPVLITLTLLALNQHKKHTLKPSYSESLVGKVGWWRYLVVLNIPIVATIVFTILTLSGVNYHSNLVVFYTTTALGFIAYIVSVLKV